MIVTTQCEKRLCKHLQGVIGDDEEDGQRHRCAAFPNGIPEEISYGENLHLEPYPGDNGIQYEKYVGPDDSDEGETEG